MPLATTWCHSLSECVCCYGSRHAHLHVTEHCPNCERKDEIRKFAPPMQDPRVETGAVRFGDDWPGVFIRGDNAFALRVTLQNIFKGLAKETNIQSFINRNALKGLIELLDSCNLNEKVRLQEGWDKKD